MANLNIFYTSPTVKKLLGWKQGGEEEKWAEKAVESLVKKLKKHKTAIDDLEKALSSPGQPSKCVTIPRSLDGRLQVAHRKNLPHVIYCRVWRWPDLTSQHELKSLDCCKFAYSAKQKEVCINPYHYKRVEISSSLGRYADSDYGPVSCVDVQLAANNNLNMSNLSLNVNNMNGSVSPAQSFSPNRPFSCISNDCPSPELNMDDFVGYSWATLNPTHRYTPRNDHWCSVSYYELNNKVGETHYVACNTVNIDGGADTSCKEGRICLGLLSNVNRNSTVELTRRSIGLGLRLERRTDSMGLEIVNLKCLSENAIFVQSRSFNMSQEYNLQTVCKVPKDCQLDVFDERIMLKKVQEIYQKYQNDPDRHFHEIYELPKMCSARLSFVKGWGESYRRVDITSTPCWIEITFFNPLKKIDDFLQQLESPCNAISSKS